MRMTNYEPPRPYAGVNQKSDRRRWIEIVLGAILIVAFFAVMLFTWSWIERREDVRADRVIIHNQQSATERAVREALK